jgi:hypothetical protein
MYYTLSQLQNSIQHKIDQFGPKSPVAAFIFTKEDVTTFDDVENTEVFYSDDVVNEVLEDVGDCDYMYEQFFELIQEVIQDVLKSQSNVE